MSDFIFKVIFTSVPFAALFVALFWVGAITGFLVYAGYMHEDYWPLMFLVQPAVIIILTSQNVALLKRIWKTFDAWLLSFYVIGGVSCLVMSVSSWKR